MNKKPESRLIKRMTSQKPLVYIGILILVAIFASGSFYYWYEKTEVSEHLDEHKKVVEVVPVSLKSIQDVVPLLGTLAATQSTMLKAKTQGMIEFLIPEGQFVKQGDVLAQIHPRHLQKKHQILKEAESIALEQWKRTTLLSESGIAPKTAIEDSYQALLKIQKEIVALQLEDLNIEAPFSGKASVREVSQGTEVFPGDNVMKIYNPHQLRLEFNLPEAIAQKTNAQTKVELNGQSYPLSFVEKHLDAKKLMCKAYANVSEDLENLIGGTLSFNLILAENVDTIVIPREALFFKKGRIMVYTVQDHKAQLKPVKLGITGRETVEILYGLEVGESLVVKGHHRLYPSMEVEIHEAS